MRLFVPMFELGFGRSGLLKPGFRIEFIPRTKFPYILFLWISVSMLGSSSYFRRIGNRLENKLIFVDDLDPKFMGGEAKSWALKLFQTPLADLQPAALAPTNAEKHVVLYVRSLGAPGKQGPADLMAI